jgi:pimeloyl-ACP methyl ester carboxylesterase
MSPAPIVISEQGSFAVGGGVVTSPGELDLHVFMSATGDVRRTDHAYVQYQMPIEPRQLPIVLWHGGSQSAKTWETTPDGREGYQTILLRRGFTVYNIDQPGLGRAGQTSFAPWPDKNPWDRSLWVIFRLGIWPDYFPGVQFDRSELTVDQYWRAVTPNIGRQSAEVITAAVAALFDRIGDAILVTHSASGRYGWLTRLRAPGIRAIISYEPAVFVFPEDDMPPDLDLRDPRAAAVAAPLPVPAAAFEELAKIPIQLVYGDNIPKEPSPYPGLDFWRIVLRRAEQFAEAVNRRGGDVTLLNLPEHGVRGNTHFPFSDLNNLEVADLLSAYLTQKQLDR